MFQLKSSPARSPNESSISELLETKRRVVVVDACFYMLTLLGHPSDVVVPDIHDMTKRGGLYPGAKPMNYVQLGVVERRLLLPARRVRCTDGIRCRAPRSSDASGRRYYVITLRTSPEICVKGCESILTERKQDMVVLVMVLQPSLHELRNTMEPWASQVATTSKLLPSAVNEWRLFGCQWLENPPLPPNIITPSRSQLLPSVHKNKKSDI
jgi:hypothetical protein